MNYERPEKPMLNRIHRDRTMHFLARFLRLFNLAEVQTRQMSKKTIGAGLGKSSR